MQVVNVQGNQLPTNAAWINRDLYPYTVKTFAVPAGRMCYVDEGQGEPVVMVHGNPTWSFVYRKLIDGLSGGYRCIAPDHIGFGQSDKPYDWSYRPEAHAENLAQLLDSLDLKDITLVVQDWGGPIGLSYAVAHPDRVKRLVILNTFMWSVKGQRYYERFSGFMGGALGAFMIRHFNAFVRMVIPMAYGDRAKLTPEILRHYRAPLPTGDSRKGSWIFPREIIGSSDWLASLWAKHENITDKPTLLAWGMKDIAFREDILNRWQEYIPHAQVKRFEDAGHYVQDEAGEALVPLIVDFLQANP
ncbi:MAG: alpha/beta fold hydrolase [Anaerolineaceae bacterium]|nr:alpha/beta fold hydrolase [Anaerolineaceae bacterium]